MHPMQILAIMGSPHKGNTFEITERFESSIKSHGEVDFQYIHLKESDIHPCKGCFLCFYKGEKHCPQKDDIMSIRNQMEEADGVVFVTPVYAMHVSYLMKLFIDRLAYVCHRPRFFGKYAVAISAAGNIRLGVKETLAYLKTIAVQWGFEYVDQLGYSAVPKITDIPVMGNKRDRLDEVAARFYFAIRDKKPRKLTIGDHLMFRCMQTMYNMMEDKSPADYQYFKKNGWLDKNTKYFVDEVKANPFNDIFARAMAGLMKRDFEKHL